MSYWLAHSVMRVLKVSQIMARNRSRRHKMTNSGWKGSSAMLPGKFPIKTLIQDVRKKQAGALPLLCVSLSLFGWIKA